MLKITIEADSDHELEEKLRRSLNADKYLAALNEIAQDIFRPARKHGYPDQKIQELLNSSEKCEEIISLLEDKFHEIIQEHGFGLDE